ncbi:MAG TPA: PHP domain-containing protein [Spirochaetales bacterium]|nr:PHP domain-containing protein [Spirochaetales bacterium]
MRADLHIHSRFSDGGHWPSDIAGLAAAAGLEAVCLTDHDTFGGCVELAEAAGQLGLASWPAVEIDCEDETLGYKSELLAYFPGGSYELTASMLAVSRAERAARVEAMFARAAALFAAPELSFGRWVEARMAGRGPGSPRVDLGTLRFAKTDLFLALKRAGRVSADVDYREFKKAYFDTGLFSDLRFAKPSLETVAESVSRDGGTLVVPHIGHEFGDSIASMRAGTRRLDAMLSRFRDLGVRGVELYYYRNDDREAMNALVTERCERFGFFHTYGSDCHGPDSNKNGLGSFYGDFRGF